MSDDGAVRAADGAEVRLIADDDELAELLEHVAAHRAYAIDTEFHRERTYFPQLALVQIAWPGGLAVVDPLEVDARALGDLLTGSALAVFHAAEQDLEVLELACGHVPQRIFDTQLAAGFLGMSTPSLASLCERMVGVRLPKAERLTDWLARPLSDEQLRYAAADVAHLLDVHRRQEEALEAEGRLAWVHAELDELLRRPRGARDPEEAWRRIKEARQLRGRAAAVARSVAAWRERRAAELDLPPRFVLSDLAVVTIAQRAPRTVDELHAVRGVDARRAGGDVGRDLLDAVARGRDGAPVVVRDERPELDRALRPAVGLVSAWVSQLARDLSIDTTLLATRADIEDLLRGRSDARLASGWRAELVGEPIRRLVAGEAALAFEGDGRVSLEERSGRPIR